MTKLDELKQLVINMGEKLNELKAEIDRVENGWEMKCPYKEGDEYYFIYDNVVDWEYWEDTTLDTERFDAGNVFPTEEAALLEAKRRYLLTRFRAFRDECNENWKADWTDISKPKFSVSIYKSKLKVYTSYLVNSFEPFGHFKNEKDAQRAIELFGKEIKELFVEV